MNKSSSSTKSSSGSSSGTKSSGSSSTASATTKTKTTQAGWDALEKFKMEAASEVGVQLKNGYNGNLTSKQAGSIGGQMVKKMIDSYKNKN
jgi:hypothetical protein